MSKHEGGCHCGKVRFRIDVTIDRLVDCNCSICLKKGIRHIPVPDDCFELLDGEQALSLYQFRTKTASHWFCRHCGIHVFGRPRADPSRHTVNARTLDDYLEIAGRVPSHAFDGHNHPKDAEPGT